MEQLVQLNPEEIKVGFVASCVEFAARKLGVSYLEAFQRLDRVGMLDNQIYESYDVLHTQSREYVTDMVDECLKRLEAEKCKN